MDTASDKNKCVERETKTVLIKVCNVLRIGDRDTLRGCGICLATNTRIVPVPNRILREGTIRICAENVIENM